MSIFSAIKNAIFGKAKESPAPVAVSAPPSNSPINTNVEQPVEATTTEQASDQHAPIGEVNVESILDAAVKIKGENLNWRVSIVDLMKLCDLDSSLSARKELADQLEYTGDMSDSATMNIWLHRQVMNKLAANGGYVPAELKD